MLTGLRPEEAARRLALGFVHEAESACARLREEEDDEALHDLRVALRRLRSTLRAYSRFVASSIPKKRLKRLRALVRATGIARDAEVQLAWLDGAMERLSGAAKEGALAWRDMLVTSVRGANREVQREVLPELETLLAKVGDDLRTYLLVCTTFEPEQRFGEVVAEATAAQLRALLAAFDRAATTSSEAEAHLARIEAKRLRYVLEPLRGELPEADLAVTALKGIQEELGALQDLTVRTESLARAVEEAAVDGARGAIARLREGRTSAAPRSEASLLALLEVAEEEKAGVLTRVLAWLTSPARTAFEDAVRRAALRASGIEDELPREIERKFLLRAVPGVLGEHAAARLDQGYLPGTKIVERLRKETSGGTTRYLRTIKLGRGATRIEVEEELAKELFQKLWPLTKGRRVLKERTAIPHGAHVWEIDVFTDRELVLAEIELSSQDEDFALPDWLEDCVEREVTGEDAYVNANLAR